MSQRKALFGSRVSTDIFYGHSLESCSSENHVLVDIMVADPGYFVRMKNISPSRLHVIFFEDTKVQNLVSGESVKSLFFGVSAFASILLLYDVRSKLVSLLRRVRVGLEP